MIDALLYSVRDAVWAAGFGWDKTTCDLQDSGKPPPRCGDWFCAIDQGASQSTMDNALNEYFGFAVTLTRRVTVPLDRVGTAVLASRLARKLAKETGFNARAYQLATFLHMNWAVLGDANTILVGFEPNANIVAGFCEPARYKGMDIPKLVGGEWFSAQPDATDVGLVSELRFDDCRRLQPIAMYV